MAIILICLLFGNVSAAKPISVKSGEHDGFSRLVFEGQDLRGWQQSVADATHVISFPSHRDGFEASSIYRFIRNNRVQSYEVGASEFSFVVGCDCYVDVFTIGNTVLVVDVKGSPGKTAIGPQKLIGLPVVSTRDQPLRFGATGPSTSREAAENPEPVASANPLVPVDLPDALSAQNSVEIALNRRQIFMPEISPASTIEPGSVRQANTLNAAQAQLLEEIGSASTRGVLSPNAQYVPPGIGEKRPQVDVRIFDSSQVPEQENSITQPGQIRITSSSDIDLSGNLKSETTTLGVICIDPKRVDVPSWSGGEQGFGQEIGELRRNLYEEFDNLNEQNAMQLARLYIHFGFGAEARSMLMLIENADQNWPELLEMAQILEYGYAPNSQNLHHYSDCDSAAALWGILANKTLDENQIINEQAALLALNTLPIHLRKFLAPELSRRLLNYGDRVGAKTAMRSLDRLPEVADDRAVLANAEIELARGDLEKAEGMLTEVVESNSEFSAEALISLIETETEAGREIDVATANLVEAYAMELRDAPLGAELRRVHVLALAKADQFQKAFEALSKLDNDEDAKSIRTRLLRLLAEDASDSDFLELLFSQMPKLMKVDEKRHLLMAAGRLQDLGFAETAEKLLMDGKVPAQGREYAMLQAEIALSLDRPAAADSFLLSLNGEDVDILRARVKEQKQDRITAHNIYTQLDQNEAAQNNAWLSEEWQTLTNPETAEFGDLVSVANHNLNASAERDGMLGRTEDMLSESSEARAIIAGILSN